MLKNKNKLSTLIPLDELEDESIKQIENCLEKSFLIKLAILPDCHTGYDLPIGGVALLDNVIAPTFVGFDIGCGMSHYDTMIPVSNFKQEEFIDIYNAIKSLIPTGEGREHDQPFIIGCDFPNASSGPTAFYDKVRSKLSFQYGTLGGGNHFIELGKSRNTNTLCITIHSGSRNPGHTVCTRYLELSKDYDTDLPDGFLHLDSELGQAYLTDMNYMLDFALKNRTKMMYDILSIFDPDFIGIDMNRFVNENHNHAIVIDNTVLHRKGATPADKNQIGIIPGNMKDGVAITIGLGNEEYLSSASHGAGRKLSRSKAFLNLDPNHFKEQMNGIISSTDESILDESPDAYKDFEHVLELQEGIVINITDRIDPIINVKGEGSGIKKYKKIMKRRLEREKKMEDRL